MKQPPKQVLKFLRWFCREDYIEEIEGDLVELFEIQCDDAPRRADWLFFWRVLLCFRPDFIKAFKRENALINTGMFKHNLLITYRTYLRNKMSFLINLIGLSSGLTCALLIFLWVQDEISVDKFHETDAQLYQVMQKKQMPDEIKVADWAPGPLAEAIRHEIPEVKYVTAYKTHPVLGGVIAFEEDRLRATPMYVDQSYLDVFSFPLLYGNENQVLKGKYNAVISADMATKLFGTSEDAIGKVITWEKKDGDFFDMTKMLTITGVFKDVPDNSTEEFDVMMNLDYYTEFNPGVNLWTNDQATAAIVVKKGTDIPSLEEKITKLVNAETDYVRDFVLNKYSSKYLYNQYENGVQAGGRITYVWLFSVIAILILIIASINFMNLSTARASIRIKEIGVKKTLGASRKSLIYQFVCESLLLSFIALFVAMMFVNALLPEFSLLTGKSLRLEFDLKIIASFLGITLITGLLSSSYPALYLSGFKPIEVLKGKLNISWGEIWARKGLVIFQFAISAILILSVLVIYQQMNYVHTKKLGYNKDHILKMKKEGVLEDKIESFLTEIRKLPTVVQAANSNHALVGAENWTTGIDWEGRAEGEYLMINPIICNYHFIETFDLQIKEGRSFSPEFGTDSSKVILNETAVKKMGLKNPIGQTITFWHDKVEIIGIAEDFHFQSLYNNVEPCIIKKAGKSDDYGEHIWIKMQSGKEKEAIAGIKQLYEEFNPGYAFAYGFLDEDYQALYESENRVSALSKYFAALAILISCLGLLGLAAFSAERRQKEIGIRKVLGANVWGIIRLLSTDFTKMILSAILIALPISIIIANRWLESFAYKIELEWWLFAGVATLILLIGWLAVGFQTFKAASINPVECLRDE